LLKEEKIMRWIVTYIKPLMLVAGALTCTVLFAAIAPQAAMQSTYGETLEGPLAELLVRNLGVLVTLVGGMLIYGAYHPAQRPMALVVAGISKITFISLVLSAGSRFLAAQAGIAIVVDTVMVLLFAAYLWQVRGDL
jgi:hypothetical protein